MHLILQLIHSTAEINSLTHVCSLNFYHKLLFVPMASDATIDIFGSFVKNSNVYTRNYLSHHTVQYGAHSFTDFSESGATSRVAHSFGSDKLYICLSNKCFNCIKRICCVTDIRPSQAYRILRICNRQINLAQETPTHIETCSTWTSLYIDPFKTSSSYWHPIEIDCTWRALFLVRTARNLV